MRVRSDPAEVARWLNGEGFGAAIIHDGGVEPVAPDAMATLRICDLLLRRTG